MLQQIIDPACTSLGLITQFLRCGNSSFHFSFRESIYFKKVFTNISTILWQCSTYPIFSLKKRRLQLMKLLKVIFPRGSRLLLLQAGSIAEFGNFHCENPLLKTG